MKTYKAFMEGKDVDKKGDGEEYKKFFQSALKKFGVANPSELKGDDKKKFYDYIDANWEGDDEKAESVDLGTESLDEGAQEMWVVAVAKNFNSLKKGAKVEVTARNTTEALKKAAKKLGDIEAWKHSGILTVAKKKSK